MDHSDPALALLDVKTMRGLEIGPLYRPRVKRSDGHVRYVDHCSTEELRDIYRWNKDMKEHLDEIVEVDYIVGPGSTLLEAVEGRTDFDYLIASHVIEHVANPIGWLAQVEEVLVKDGLVSLVIPDKRYCFDVNRVETRSQDWVDWYFRDLRQPSYAHIFDFYAHAVTIDGAVDTAGIWAGTVDYTGVRRSDVPDADVAGYKACLDLQSSGRYMDVHTGAYTPLSFLDLLDVSARIGLLNYEVAHLVPTPRDELEFYVTLRKVGPGSPGRIVRSIAAAKTSVSNEDARSYPAVVEVTTPGPMTDLASGPDAPRLDVAGGPLILSDKERSLIEAKRVALFVSRTGLHMLKKLIKSG